MNKRYIILFIGVILLFIIFAAVLFFQSQTPSQKPPTPSSLQSQNPANLPQTAQNNTSKNTLSVTPDVTLPPLATTAKEATKQFYNYYFSTPSNPLANGAFKNNPYISDDLKQVLASLYNNGNAPLFCPQNKRANIVVGQESQNYFDNQYITQEVISEASGNNKDLYRVSLENKDGKWLIFDVNCIY